MERLNKSSHRCSSEAGNVLIYTVICIVFLSALGVFFRGSSMPIFSHTSDTRGLYESQYLIDTVESTVADKVSALQASEINSSRLRSLVNGINTISLADSKGRKAVITRLKNISNSDISIEGWNQKRVKIKNMQFKLTLFDGTVVIRRNVVLTVPLSS